MPTLMDLSRMDFHHRRTWTAIRIVTNYLPLTAIPLEANSEIASQTTDECKSDMGAEGVGLTVSDRYVIDNHMYADFSWRDFPREELVDLGDD